VPAGKPTRKTPKTPKKTGFFAPGTTWRAARSEHAESSSGRLRASGPRVGGDAAGTGAGRLPAAGGRRDEHAADTSPLDRGASPRVGAELRRRVRCVSRRGPRAAQDRRGTRPRRETPWPERAGRHTLCVRPPSAPVRRVVPSPHGSTTETCEAALARRWGRAGGTRPVTPAPVAGRSRRRCHDATGVVPAGGRVTRTGCARPARVSLVRARGRARRRPRAGTGRRDVPKHVACRRPRRRGTGTSRRARSRGARRSARVREAAPSATLVPHASRGVGAVSRAARSSRRRATSRSSHASRERRHARTRDTPVEITGPSSCVVARRLESPVSGAGRQSRPDCWRRKSTSAMSRPKRMRSIPDLPFASWTCDVELVGRRRARLARVPRIARSLPNSGAVAGGVGPLGAGARGPERAHGAGGAGVVRANPCPAARAAPDRHAHAPRAIRRLR